MHVDRRLEGIKVDNEKDRGGVASTLENFCHFPRAWLVPSVCFRNRLRKLGGGFRVEFRPSAFEPPRGPAKSHHKAVAANIRTATRATKIASTLTIDCVRECFVISRPLVHGSDNCAYCGRDSCKSWTLLESSTDRRDGARRSPYLRPQTKSALLLLLSSIAACIFFPVTASNSSSFHVPLFGSVRVRPSSRPRTSRKIASHLCIRSP